MDPTNIEAIKYLESSSSSSASAPTELSNELATLKEVFDQRIVGLNEKLLTHKIFQMNQTYNFPFQSNDDLGKVYLQHQTKLSKSIIWNYQVSN